MIAEAVTGGLLLGFFSSLHCIGMCGPLALALPVQHLPEWQQRLAAVTYNAGRVVTYAFFGLLFGLAGRSLHIAGLQQWLSIISGSFILLFIINYYLLKKAVQPAWTLKLHAAVQQLMIRTLHTKHKAGYLLLGMVNGLLPCGMVYVALAAALNFHEVKESVFFMSSFGAGTIPLMILLNILGSSFSFSVRSRIKKVVPYLMTVTAVLLILRGMNLGIPFISPVMAGETATAIPCH
nr:sulfite exporter TauE/SafE family protein [uncultured Lacibacter sp.]